jgi:ribonuclease-3
LGLVVTDHIFSRYPELPEGSMAKLRSDVVSSVSLAAVARELDIGEAISLGKGEESSGGRHKSSILADALEAVIGAVYVDGGWAPAAAIVMDRFAARIERAARRPGLEDYKTRLQEHVAGSGCQPPVYDVTGVGPDHEKQFFATVSIAGEVLGRGEGRTKKEAEQGAAGEAWEHLASAGANSGAADPDPTTTKATP